MRLRHKLSALVLLVCGLLVVFVGYLLWHSWRVDNQTRRFVPALSYLCGISDARSWVTRQVKDGFDYLTSGEKWEFSEYSRDAHQVSAAFVTWEEAIAVQRSLGVTGEEDDLEQIMRIRAAYRDWQDYNLALFDRAQKLGRDEALRKYIDGVDRMVQGTIYSQLDDALEDGLGEVDDSYRATLLVLGSTPWTASVAMERVEATKATIAYLVAASRLSAALNKQIAALMHYLFSDKKDHHQYLLMQAHAKRAFIDLSRTYEARAVALHLDDGQFISHLEESMDQAQSLADKMYQGRQAGLGLQELRETDERLERLLDAELVPCLIRTLQQGSGNLKDLTNTANNWLVGMLTVGCVLFSLMTMKLIRGVFQAIEKLRAGMEIIADGDYAHRIELIRADELGELGASFDKMASRLDRTRRELEDLYQGMEQRVIDRTRQLELANKELESFNYSVSHDLRGALTQVSGLTQLMMVEGKRMPESDAQGYRERICLATARMAQTIDGLMQLARISGQTARQLPVDLSAIVQDVAAELQGHGPKRVVQFHITPDVVVMGDETLLRLAMQNLLGNAWKYTASEANGRIEFGVVQGNGEITCYVRDNGIGFEPEDADKVFTPFVRLNNAATIAGEGVGLATVQRIIQRHGGTIRAEGVPGSGATFTFTLPSAHTGS